MKILSNILFFLFLSFFSACGSLEVTPVPSPTPSDSTAFKLTWFGFGTDYTGSGQLYRITYESSEENDLDGALSVSSTGISSLGTEAHLLKTDETLEVLHAGGSFNSISTDNILSLSVSNNSLSVKNQTSLGNGTNPQAFLLSPDKKTLYVSFYNPEADPYNISENSVGQYGDVVFFDLDTQTITHRFSFYDDLNPDNLRRAWAYKLAVDAQNNILYVLLQDLGTLANAYSANSYGLVGRIDLATNTKLDPFILSCYNPSDLELSSDNSKLFVSCADDFSGSTLETGLEVLETSSGVSQMFIEGSVLGGYPAQLKRTKNKIFMTVSEIDLESFNTTSQIKIFDETISDQNQIVTLIDPKTEIRDFSVQSKWLLTASRDLATATQDPLVSLYTVDTVNHTASFMIQKNVDLPVISLSE